MLRKTVAAFISIVVLVTSPQVHAAISKIEAAKLTREGKFGEAADMYRALLKKKPRSIKLHMNLADNLARDGQFGAAADTYRTLLERKPRSIKFRMKLADNLTRDGQFDEAADTYRTLLKRKPRSIKLRMNLADNLARDQQWDAAVSEYKIILKRKPKHVQALLGLATVQRWQGDVPQALKSYKRAQKVAPKNVQVRLGRAATYALDHNFGAANRDYNRAVRKWPRNKEVQQAAEDFHQRTKPRLYLFYEDDLSYRTEQLGLAMPFGSREEFGAETQRETSFYYRTGAITYQRNDTKLMYTHYFGLDHNLDFSARQSSFDYPVPPSSGGFSSAIDTYDEYRLRYTRPLTREQVAALRYTNRPTTLVHGQTFVSHKLEIELHSAWTPRFSTLLGTGKLRDLAENPASESDLNDYSLVKLGFEFSPTTRISFGARYITNPDLDNSIDSTTLMDASYSFDGPFSTLMRHRADDHKQGDDQQSIYIGMRYVPNSQFWSEFGVKQSERGAYSGTYPLASVVYKL